MKIVICSSLDFIDEIKDVREKLFARGHVVTVPETPIRFIVVK